MKTNNKQLNKGFTIIETLVAVFILSIAITAFMTLTSQSILTARYARNEITANYLAQEAADYIRNQRDTTAFIPGENNWNAFITKFNLPGKSCIKPNSCYIDIRENSISACPSNGCPNLSYRDSGKSFYYYDASGKSVFKRTITMEEGSGTVGTDEVYVTITIDWKNGSADKTKVLHFSLLNWYQF
jgi:prepilin-type N-terminal cleavage/methylation domain-containing protein